MGGVFVKETGNMLERRLRFYSRVTPRHERRDVQVPYTTELSIYDPVLAGATRAQRGGEARWARVLDFSYDLHFL